MIVRDIMYREGVDDGEGGVSAKCRLDLHVPDGAPGCPVLVWFHGGGLTEGDRAIPPGLMGRDVAVASAGYRLHPAVHAPAYVEDAAAAVAWVLRHAARFGASPDGVFVGGASAGAYLAALVTLDRRWLAAHGEDAGRIAGLLCISGQAITHFTVRQERGIPGHQPVIDELAPLYHVRADAPPTLLVTGDRELELFGRYEENAYFRRMLLVAGHRDVELHELPGRDHAGVELGSYPLIHAFIHRVIAAR